MSKTPKMIGQGQESSSSIERCGFKLETVFFLMKSKVIYFEPIIDRRPRVLSMKWVVHFPFFSDCDIEKIVNMTIFYPGDDHKNLFIAQLVLNQILNHF